MTDKLQNIEKFTHFDVVDDDEDDGRMMSR
jgi:hypothetical protein